jgi:hypothetical protein
MMLVGCDSTTASEPARCARIWNEEPPADLSERFDEAIVYRWTDKAGDDGCGVIFHSGRGSEWVIFGGGVDDGHVTHWSREVGEGWGEDSPEGDVPTDPNVVVRPGGRLVVPGP